MGKLLFLIFLGSHSYGEYPPCHGNTPFAIPDSSEGRRCVTEDQYRSWETEQQKLQNAYDPFVGIPGVYYKPGQELTHCRSGNRYLIIEACATEIGLKILCLDDLPHLSNSEKAAFKKRYCEN